MAMPTGDTAQQREELLAHILREFPHADADALSKLPYAELLNADPRPAPAARSAASPDQGLTPHQTGFIAVLRQTPPCIGADREALEAAIAQTADTSAMTSSEARPLIDILLKNTSPTSLHREKLKGRPGWPANVNAAAWLQRSAFDAQNYVHMHHL
jgi:hypothetical protein